MLNDERRTNFLLAETKPQSRAEELNRFSLIPEMGFLLLKTQMIVKCKVCGKEIYRRPYSIRKNKHSFCSFQCLGIFQRNGGYKICPVCGEKFYVRKCKIKTQIYCSGKCLYASRKGKGFNGKPCPIRYGKDSPSWKGGKMLKCLYCGKQFWAIPSRIKSGRKFCSSKCFGFYYVDTTSKRVKGKNNPMWRGGTSKLPYPFKWTETLKESIRQRDNYKCQLCGCPQEENITKLHIHHIDYNKNNLDPDNLVSLCQSCHSKTNVNREKWIKKLTRK